MRKNAISAVFIAALFLLFGAVPQFAAGQQGSQQPQNQQGQQQTYFLASHLIGKTVKNQQGKTLGSINDLIVGQNGQIDYAIVGRGGVWGVGEKNTPVPWQAGNFKVEKNEVMSTLSEDKIKNAPKLTGGNWSQELAQSGYEQKVHSYYGSGQGQKSQGGAMSGQGAGQSQKEGASQTQGGHSKGSQGQ